MNNNYLNITISAEYFLYNNLLINYYENKESYNPNITKLRTIDYRIPFSCKVVKTFKNNYGKVKASTKNIIFMEMEFFYQTLSEFIPNEIIRYFPNYRKKVYNINSNDYGTQLIVNFPKSRVNNYIESDYHKLLFQAIT